METTPRDFDTLLAQAGWARALARHLVRDPDRADDLVQRAWLAALRRPPADGTPPRRWLATVMRNFVRQDARESSRREQREHAVARLDRTLGVDAIDDAAALQVRLIAAVNELPEPSRSTVWARYYDGLAPREIAARDGVPVDTVKTRLARGLDALRKRFDREAGGDRSAWLAAFAPLARPSSAVLVSIGVILMHTKWKLAIAAAVLLCGVGAWIVVSSAGPDSTDSNTRTLLELAKVPRDSAKPGLANVGELATREPVAQTPLVTPLPESSAGVVRGRVLDFDRRPVADLEIGSAHRTEPSSVRSAADGTFEIPAKLAGNALSATGHGWATVWVDSHKPSWDAGGGVVTILVAKAAHLSGVVRDGLGRPVPRAFVATSLSAAGRRPLADLFTVNVFEIGYFATSDAAGHFDLGEVPLVRGTISAKLDERESSQIEMPTKARDDLELRFETPVAEGITLRGRVLDAEGAPASDAVVALGMVTKHVQEDGTFELSLDPAQLAEGRSFDLIAAQKGALPARITIGDRKEVELTAQRSFELVLGGTPLHIQGRIVDSDGMPIAGTSLRLDEESIGSVAFESHGMPQSRPASIEYITRGRRGIRPSGEDGSFEIEGLQNRAYELRVLATSRMTGRVVQQVVAGTTDLIIELDTHENPRHVAGHVLDVAGQPIAGALVSVEVSVPGFDGAIRPTSLFSDATGAFQIELLRGEPVEVSALHQGAACSVRLKPGDALDDVRITIVRMCAIQIDARSRPEFANRVEILDPKRGRLLLSTTDSRVGPGTIVESRKRLDSLPIVDGLSDVLTVFEGDLTAVLFRGDEEVGRVPIVLAREGLTTVRF